MVALRWKKDELLALLEAAPELRQRMEHVAVEAVMRRLLRRDSLGVDLTQEMMLRRASLASNGSNASLYHDQARNARVSTSSGQWKTAPCMSMS